MILVKKDLKHHFSSVHEGNKPSKCVNCGFRSTSNKDLSRHIAAIHEGKKDSIVIFVIKDFQEKRFSRKTIFKKNSID